MMKKQAPSTARERALETRVRELETVIEALADSGLIVLGGQRALDTRYQVGYRQGALDTAQQAMAANQEHYLTVELPLRNALRALEVTLVAAVSFSGQTAIHRADLRDALRPQALRFADEIRATYETAEEQFVRVGLSFIDDDAQRIILFRNALREFGLGRDDGEALAACEAVRESPAASMWAALDGLRMGGQPASDARAWIGQQIEKLRSDRPLTYPAAAAQLYQALIDKERAHELLEVEEKALRALDNLAVGEFRRRKNLTPKVKRFCKKAAEDWRKQAGKSAPNSEVQL